MVEVVIGAEDKSFKGLGSRSEFRARLKDKLLKGAGGCHHR